MAWIFLLVAGLLEVAGASGLKHLAERFSLLLLIVTAAAMIASLGALYWSMTRLPLGVAYPIWTGIGSIGSVIVGMTVFGHHPGPAGFAGISLLLAGMVLLGFDTH